MSEKKSNEDRQMEVDRQLQLMKAAIGDDSLSDDDSSTDESGDLKERNSKRDAMESARKFLWDEDDDDEVPLGGPYPSSSAGAGPKGASQTPEDDDMGIDHDINLMEASKPRSSAQSGSKKSWGSRPPVVWNDAAPSKESYDYMSKRRNHSTSTRELVAMLFCYALIVGGLAAVIFFGFVINKEPTPPKQFGDGRFTDIANALVSKGYADMATLTKEITPQHKAVKWLASEDSSRLAPDYQYLPQRYALAVLYLETWHEDGWVKSDNWLSGKGLCTWYGVSCVGDSEFFEYAGDADVFELNLTKNELKGTVPTEISALSQLFELELKGNQLYGTIPTEIWKLTNLRALSLASNNIGGTIPTEIWSLPNFHILALNANKLSGSLTEHFGKASNLRSLYLGKNLLSGSLPGSIGYLTRLEDLYIGNNGIWGTLPPSLYRLTRLEELELHYNNLKGNVTTSLGQLSHLEMLALQGNMLTGEVPDVFQNLNALQSLYLDKNSFSGTIPASIGTMQRLRSLTAQENPGLEGAMPEDVCILTTSELKHLSVDCKDATNETSTGVECSCCTECF